MGICAIALVLLLDVSGSVTPDSYRLQSHGVSDSFQDQALHQVIENMPNGMAITVIEWSTGTRTVAPWRILRTAEDAEQLSRDLRDARTPRGGMTAIGAAIRRGIDAFESVPCEPEQRVIDVSGDGESNQGEHPSEARDAAEQLGITINGLPIINETEPTLSEYYEQHVITSDGFVIEANGFNDFARAIRRKLILEITMR